MLERKYNPRVTNPPMSKENSRCVTSCWPSSSRSWAANGGAPSPSPSRPRPWTTARTRRPASRRPRPRPRTPRRPTCRSPTPRCPMRCCWTARWRRSPGIATTQPSASRRECSVSPRDASTPTEDSFSSQKRGTSRATPSTLLRRSASRSPTPNTHGQNGVE